MEEGGWNDISAGWEGGRGGRGRGGRGRGGRKLEVITSLVKVEVVKADYIAIMLIFMTQDVLCNSQFQGSNLIACSCVVSCTIGNIAPYPYGAILSMAIL